VSLGMASTCGISGSSSKTYLCWGADITLPYPQINSSKIYYNTVFGTNHGFDPYYPGYYYVVYYGPLTTWATHDENSDCVPQKTVAGGTYTFLSNINQLSLGGNYSLVDGTTSYSSVTGFSTSQQISDVGSACAVLENGAIYCWGGNYFGSVGNGSTVRSNSSVTCSSSITTGTNANVITPVAILAPSSAGVSPQVTY
jgi:hypothetical protein